MNVSELFQRDNIFQKKTERERERIVIIVGTRGKP